MKKYKNWLIHALSAFFILSVSFLIAVYFFLKTPFYNSWIQYLYNYNDFYLKNVHGRKIIVLGGSNVHYGIRTSDIEKAFGIPCVNMGIYGSFGMDLQYLLYRAKNYIQKGDIVIIAPEYDTLSVNKNYNRGKLFYLLECDKKYFNSLPFSEKLSNINNLKLFDLIEGLQQQFCYFVLFNFNKNHQTNSLTDRIKEQIYSLVQKKMAHYLLPPPVNKNCDGTNNLKEKKLEVKEDIKKHINPYIINTVYQETSELILLKEFKQWCDERGVILFVTYESVLYLKHFDKPRWQKYFSFLENYYRQNHITTLGKPQDFLYSEKYMYDTPHHLNQQGMSLRTEKIIKELKNSHL